MRGSLIALTMTPEDVKLAEISHEDGGKSVKCLYQQVPDPDDRIGLSTIIKKFISEERPRSRKTILVLNGKDVNYKEFSFPFRSNAKVKKAIQYEVNSEYPVDDYVIDYIEIASKEEGKKAYLTAIADTERLKEKIHTAKKAGLQIIGITSDISTLGNYFWSEDEVFVMEMGKRQTLFVLYQTGMPVLTRGIRMGVGDLLNGSGNLDPKKLRPLAGEIKRTIHSFQVKSGTKLDRIYVSGQIVSQKELLGRLKEDLELDFIEGTPLETHFKIKDSDDDLNTYASLLGAAEWKKKNRSFNFFKDEVLKSEPGSVRRSCFRWGSILFFLAIVVLLSSAWLKVVAFDKRKDFLTTEMREIFRTTFPDTKRIVDEVRQARNFLNAERKDVNGENPRLQATILDVLRIISENIPEGTSFKILSLFWERGKVEINGKTDSFKTANLIQEMLSGSQIFSEVKISNAKMISEGQDVEFKISIRLAG